MKVRNGFVSNSSSSSFIVIGNGKREIPEFFGDRISIPETFGGETEFGWDWEEYHTFSSRLNFAVLQANYKDPPAGHYVDWYYERLKPSDEWKKMLIKVLSEDFKVDPDMINISFDENNNRFSDGTFAYIDHQSNVGDGNNAEMFESEDSLRDFLYCKNSMIKTGNDNEEDPNI